MSFYILENRYIIIAIGVVVEIYVDNSKIVAKHQCFFGIVIVENKGKNSHPVLKIYFPQKSNSL